VLSELKGQAAGRLFAPLFLKICTRPLKLHLASQLKDKTTKAISTYILASLTAQQGIYNNKSEPKLEGSATLFNFWKAIVASRV
jgi:hypothetical protein